RVELMVDLAEEDPVVAFAREEVVDAPEVGDRRGAAGRGARLVEERLAGAGPREAGEVPVLLIVVREVERAIGLDRPADAQAELLAVLVRLERGEEVLGLERIVAQEVEALAVDLVGPRSGDGVDRAAGGAAELGGEVADADLELADRRLADRVRRARAAAGLGEQRLVVVDAV